MITSVIPSPPTELISSHCLKNTPYSSDTVSNFELTSSNTNVADITADGSYQKVTAKNIGTAVITVRNKRSGFAGTFTVVVRGEGTHREVASMLTAGEDFQAALKANGTVWAWGKNNVGQLGDGTDVNRGHVVPVLRPADATTGVVNTANIFTRATHIAAGKNFLLIVEDGKVYSTGYNSLAFKQNYVTYEINNIPSDVEIIAVAAGDEFGLALGKNGYVYSWGVNTNGQLGRGSDLDDDTRSGNYDSTVSTAVDIRVQSGESGSSGTGVTNETTLSNIVAIAAGSDFALALKSDGTVYSWGSNDNGQLGVGSKGGKMFTPVQVRRGASVNAEDDKMTIPTGGDYLRGITQIAAGADHSLALGNNGYVYGWGANALSQLGDNTNTEDTLRYVPVQVKAAAPAGLSKEYVIFDDVVAIAAKNNQSFAITSNGDGYAWGQNGSNYKLGIAGDTSNKNMPAHISKGDTPSAQTYVTNVSNIAGGTTNSVLSLDDGYVYTWSRNDYWQLGNLDDLDYESSNVLIRQQPRYTGAREEDLIEFFTDTAKTDQIPYIKNMETGDTIEIKALNLHHLYGFNLEQDDTHTDLAMTNVVFTSSNNNVVSVSGSTLTAGTHTGVAVVTAKDTVSGYQSSITITVRKASTNASPMVSGGYEHAVALNDKGEVWTWGNNSKGQLGDGTTVTKTYPVKVDLPDGDTAVYVAATKHTTFAVSKTDGYVYAWGNGETISGELGLLTVEQVGGSYVSRTSSLTPIKIMELNPDGTYSPLRNIAKITASETHALALTRDGYVYAWGDNHYGQLGNGDASQSSGNPFYTARTPNGVYAAVKVNNGESAATSDSTGDNWKLQDVIDISAGYNFSVAVKADGSVWAWGRNQSVCLELGQGLGENGTPDETLRTVPVQVKAGNTGTGTYMEDIISVGTGYHHTLALTSEGKVYAWTDWYQCIQIRK